MIKNLKRDNALDIGCRRFRNNPRRVEVLNGFKTGNNRGFQTGGRENNEIMSECGIVRFVNGKVQIKINKRRHQVGFTRAHRKAEQIIRIGNAVKGVVPYLVVIYTFGCIFDRLFKLDRNLLIIIVFHAGVLKKSRGRRFGEQIFSCGLRKF